MHNSMNRTAMNLSKTAMNLSTAINRKWIYQYMNIYSYPCENCPKLSLRSILVPGGRSSWLLPLGMEMEPSGMWTRSSGGLIGTLSSGKEVGDKNEPSFWVRGPEISGFSAGAWLCWMDTGEMSGFSEGTIGVPYTGAGTWGAECVIGIGGASSSMRGVLYRGDATADVSSITNSWNYTKILNGTVTRRSSRFHSLIGCSFTEIDISDSE